jgi:hypothetical protein
MNIKVIQDLNELGYPILYMEDYGRYYVVTEFTPVNISDHIYNNELKGKDITEKIQNLDVNFSDIRTIETIIKNTTEIHLRFHEGIKWLWFSS